MINGYRKIETEENNNKKNVANGLMDPQRLYLEAMQKGGLKKPKNDILERRDDRLLTNDGREMLNEKK
jgi:hypothetical protein